MIDALPSQGIGSSHQLDAATQAMGVGMLVSTDPPYYDNIGYADLSDFFYVWIRRSLRPVYPGLFGTMAVPKADELVATPYRHEGKDSAEAFFLDGMTKALHRIREQSHPAFPVTVYYAFKQSETRGDTGTASTGWETFLDATIRSGFSITGTWPIRTEGAGRILARGTNALASSIVLVCRRRPVAVPSTPLSQRAASSSPPCALNSPRLSSSSSPATSPPLISLKRPSAPAWQYTPDTGRCSTPRESR